MEHTIITAIHHLTFQKCATPNTTVVLANNGYPAKTIEFRLTPSQKQQQELCCFCCTKSQDKRQSYAYYKNISILCFCNRLNYL